MRIASPVVASITLVALAAGAFADEENVWPGLPLEVREAAPTRGPDAFVFADGFGRGEERPAVADLDADGFADLVMFVGSGGRVYVCPNERGLEAHHSRKVIEGLGCEAAPGVVADLDGNGRPCLVTLSEKGALVAGRRDPDGDYEATAVCPLPEGLKAPLRLLAGDIDGNGLDDIAILSADGPAHVVRALRPGHVVLEALSVAVPLDAQLGDVTGDGRAELVWREEGRLVALLPSAKGERRRVLLTSEVDGDLLAVGDVDGDGRDDLVVRGAWLLVRDREVVRIADPRLEIDLGRDHLRLGDIDGDGRQDAVVFQYHGRRDVAVALSRPPAFYVRSLPGLVDTDHDLLSDAEERFVHRTDPYRRDTDQDGILDGFEVRGFRGHPLTGASPLRRDVFLELDVEAGADRKRVEKAVRMMERLFAAAPIENPDGSTGITVHCVIDDEVDQDPEAKANRHQLREMYFTPERAGVFHWMFLGAKGGGGQANLLSDHGACAGAYEATLPHEFGHQLGLKHGGASGLNGIPIYPSLMNYAYNYQLHGKRSLIDYSRGHLSHLSFDEDALPERVEVPAEHLRFLAGPPFHFRVEPRPLEAAPPDADGEAAGAEGEAGASWVDWNRNGVEDEAPVRANINAASGEGYGRRDILDKVRKPKEGDLQTSSERAPVLLAVGAAGDDHPGRLALLFVSKERDELAASVLDDGDRKRFSIPRALSGEQGLDLLDAYADGERIHLFARQGGSVVELSGTLDAEEAWTKTAVALGERAGHLEPATTFRRGEARVLWRGGMRLRIAPIGAVAYLALRNPEDGTVWVRRRGAGATGFDEGRVIPELTSETPVGLAIDTVRDELLVAFTTTQTRSGKARPWRLRLARLDPDTLEVLSTEWVGGPKGSDATSRRPAIVFGTAPWLAPEGQVDIFHSGLVDAERPSYHMFRSYTIGDRAWRGRRGWKEDMTWNEWSYSKDAPTAAWYRGRPWQATRFYTHYSSGKAWNDHLAIGPNADGICDKGLTDTNDWEIVESYGLERSILQTRVPTGRR